MPPLPPSDLKATSLESVPRTIETSSESPPADRSIFVTSSRPMSGDAAEAQRTRAANGSGGSSNRIQVSNTKKPLFFYVNLAKVFIYLFTSRSIDRLRVSLLRHGLVGADSFPCVARRGTCSSTARSSSPRSAWVRRLLLALNRE